MLGFLAVLTCLGGLEASTLRRQKADPATLALPLTDVLANVSYRENVEQMILENRRPSINICHFLGNF